MKRFKNYDQNQGILLPPYLEDIIPEKDLVRVVNSFVNEIDDELLERPFSGDGCPSYSPKMMMKVLLYAYSSKVYSSRKIARLLTKDIHFMWLSGMQKPNFRTINRFRSDYFKEIIEDVFAQISILLLDKNYIQGKDYFLDGTMLEANANKYSYVWKKNTQRYKNKAQERAVAIIKEINQINEDEELQYKNKDLPETGENSDLSSDEIRKAAKEIKQQAKEVGDAKASRKLNSQSRKLEKEAEKVAKYEEQENLLNGRNSYSKTDPDATFLRMKNDELKPGYNVQAGTENGFICGFSVHPNANDGVTFPEHFRRREKAGLPHPVNLIADAGYGNEENYSLLDDLEVGNYMKYPDFHRETSGKESRYFELSDFIYNSDEDCYICPEGRALFFDHIDERANSNGYIRKSRIYKSQDCSECPLHAKCKRGEYRTLSVMPLYNKQKKKVRENLESLEGTKLRKRRAHEVETVFGHLKYNMNYQRIRLRSMAKATIEMALLFMSHNLIKVNRASC